MMGTGPHVGKGQRPEVDDRQAIRIDGAAGLLGHEVIHHAQEAGGQEEAHRVVAVPPLHHGVLYPRIGGVRLPQRHRHLDVVEDVQDGDGQDVRAEEPVGHVDMLGPTLDDGAEEHNGVGHPDQRDQDVDGPFEFGVFLAAGVAQRQGDGGRDDDRLPAPEGERGQPVTENAGLTGALDNVVRGREQRAAAEGEDHGVGVQRAQAAVAEPGGVEIQLRPNQLRGEKNAHSHADDAPDHGHERELPHDPIVEGVGLACDCGAIVHHPSPKQKETSSSRFQ
ncbi:Uncharacterised protein [Achromobacter xylosoxidans]|nr:Uncharacterised protein [Achromobacter xylosoxidans]